MLVLLHLFVSVKTAEIERGFFRCGKLQAITALVPDSHELCKVTERPSLAISCNGQQPSQRNTQNMMNMTHEYIENPDTEPP